VLVLQALDANLDSRFKSLKPLPLAYIFLINNFHYIARHMARHRSLFSRSFADAYVEKVKRYTAHYKEETWKQLLSVLDAKDAERCADNFQKGVKNAKDPIKLKFKAQHHTHHTRRCQQRGLCAVLCDVHCPAC
jgi:hypothetical protein